MITKNNITEFYEKYRKNLEMEDLLNESVLRAEDEESWIERLRAKSKGLRDMYIENEAMLNLYLRPFLEQESLLTEELAEEFFQQITIMNSLGYCDRVTCIAIGEVLQHYFEKNGNYHHWIRTTHFLGGFYSRYSTVADVEKCLACFDLEREQLPRYEQIDDWDVRKSIMLSFYNYAVVWNNAGAYRSAEGELDKTIYYEQLIDEADRAMQVFDDPVIRALDGDNYDLDGLKQELCYDIYGNVVCGCNKKEDMSEAMLVRTEAVLKKLYAQAVKEHENVFEIEDEIYCNYWKLRLYLNEISIEEYVQKMMDYCDYVLEHDKLSEREEDSFVNSRYFQVNMYQIPNLASIQGIREKRELFEQVKEYILPRFLKFVEELPRKKEAVFVNGPLRNTILDLAENIGSSELDTHYLLNVLLNRDENLTIHAAMVKRLALTVVQKILEKRPELLVGTLGNKSVVEVLEHREEIESAVAMAALVYDIGKLHFVDEVNLQSRSLEEWEKQRVRQHTQMGYDLLKKLGFEEVYCDIARGHHKYYDGKSGDPADYDNTASEARFLTDLIKICDSLDAATDDIGRIYRKKKQFSEFMAELKFGAGHHYNPDIAAVIEENSELYDELQYISTSGRVAIYYEMYHDFVSTEGVEGQKAEHQIEERQIDRPDHFLEDIAEANRAREQVLMSMAKSMLLIARIHSNEDRMQVVHCLENELLAGARDGSFREFVEGFCREKIHPEDYPKLRRLTEYGGFSDSLYPADGSFELEVRMLRGEDYSWVRMQFLVAEEKSGVPQVIVLTVRDIDATKRQQQQLKTAIELAHERAEQANRAKSEFLSNMSHDMRTPMNVILGMTQIARSHMDDPDRVADCIGKIEQASTHLLGLVNEVLDMSKIENGRMELECKPVELRRLLENVLMMVQGEITRKQIDCTVDVSHLPEEQLLGDEVKIREILLNILSNAVKYTPEGRWISVYAEKTPETIGEYQSYRLIVSDGGIGMSKEFLGRLFEPFVRERQEASKNVTGTGLGLSITKAIVELMHGYIHVNSILGEGSTFEVVIRLCPSQEQRMTEEPERGICLSDCINRFAGKRVLLVEDNELNREIFVELVEDTGITVEEAENGQIALQMVREHGDRYYDMIFMDAQMPVMDGYESTRQIRNLERTEGRSRVPIAAITANVFAEDVDAAMEAGMDTHLGKPLELTKVLSEMIHLMG